MHLALLLALCATQTDAAPAPLRTEISMERRLLATGLALVPGAAIPGLGHRIEGDRVAANRLLTISLVSVAAAIAGGVTLSATEGSGKLAPVYLPLLWLGASGLGASWLSDVVGSARPDGWPRAFAAEESLTAALLYGPSFGRLSDVHHLGILRAAWEGQRGLVDGWASLAPGTRYQEIHLRAGFKILSDKQKSHLALVVEGMRELGASSDASAHGAAAMIEVRLDAGLISHSMSGLTFLERVGGGFLLYSYERSAANDVQSMLVLETGVALCPIEGLELSVVYNMRPDNRLGFVTDHGGAFQLEARYQVIDHLRVVAQGHIGMGGDALVGVETSW